MKKKVTKASKRRLLCFGTISICVVVYFFISLSYYTYHIYNLKKQEQDLALQLNSLQKEEQSLKTEIEKLKDPDYLARYARENYSYSKDGELVLQLPKKQEKKVSEVSSFEPHYYLLIGGGVILFLILVYVIKKRK